MAYLRQAMVSDESAIKIEDEEALAGAFVGGLEVGQIDTHMKKGGRKGGREGKRDVPEADCDMGRECRRSRR